MGDLGNGFGRSRFGIFWIRMLCQQGSNELPLHFGHGGATSARTCRVNNFPCLQFVHFRPRKRHSSVCLSNVSARCVSSWIVFRSQDAKVRGVLCSDTQRHLVISFAVESPTGHVFPHTAPLFEKERHVCLATCAKNFADPFDLHWTSAES
jgi:hypothetical protein